MRFLMPFAACCLLAASEAAAFNTYTNIALKTTDRDKVVETLRALRRRAYVSPATAGYVVVFDSGTEREPDTLFDVVTQLSDRLKCAAVGAYDHDDALLILVVAKDGKKVDTYVSNPGYFQGKREAPRGGNPAAVQEALGIQGEDARLKEVFASQVFELEVERHNEMIRVLGLPDYCRGAGHKYFRDDVLPWKYDRKAWEIIGQP